MKINSFDQSELHLKGSISNRVCTILWIIFGGSLIRDLLPTNEITTWIYYGCVHGGGLLLILQSLFFFKYIDSFRKYNNGYWLIKPTLLVCFIGTLLGLVKGAAFPGLIAGSLLTYSGSLLILLPAEELIRKKLLVTFRWQFLIAIIFGLYSLINPVEFEVILQNAESWAETSEKTALMLLGLVPFFFGLAIKKVDKLTLLATISGYFIYIVLGLRAMSRATLIINFLVIPSALLAVILKHDKPSAIPFIFKSLLVALIIIGCLTTLQPGITNQLAIGDALQKTLYRLAGYQENAGVAELKRGLINNITREIEVSRGAEALDYLTSSSWYDYLFGKGFGISWYSSFWSREWNMVHIGPVHLIYKGGIVLLVLYFSILIYALRTSWRNIINDPISMGSFIYLVVWIARFFSYGNHQSSYYSYVFWLIIGLSLSADFRKEKQEYSKHANIPVP